jgi:PAS domain S-box-containing protein
LTQSRSLTLEDLRHSSAPAWLWDAERGRLVWANSAGVAVFGGENVFDLVDRPFDRQEAGVAAIAKLGQTLKTGESQRAELAFPSIGSGLSIRASCTLHLLADGRQGVLVVGDLPHKPIGDVPHDLAGAALMSLPLPVLVLEADGRVLHANAAAKAMLDLTSARNLSHLFNRSETAANLLQRLEKSEITSSIESVVGPLGLRDVRVTLARLGSGTQVSAMLEDVTDRRALERSLALQPDASPPLRRSPQDAFAQLAKSLHDSIGTPVPAAKPAPAVAKPEPAAKANHAPSGLAPLSPGFVPLPVRSALEGTGQAILIGKSDAALYATAKAAALLGYGDATALLSDRALWHHLKSAPKAPHSISLPLPDGAAVDLTILAGSIPWLNGPAEQFVLKPALRAQDAAPPPEATPVATQSTALARPAPVRQATATPGLHLSSDQIIEAEELKAMLDVASDGIIALDATGAILSFSAGAQSIFGVSPEDVKGRNLSDLLTPESRKPLRDYLAALNGPGLASVFNDGREFTAVVKQGGEVPLFVTLGKLQSPHSKAAFCAVVRDVTPWKRTERELREAKDQAEQASKQKSDFLAAISHEIRTPLNAIIGFSDVMRLERFGELRNDKYRAYAHDIHSSGAHLLSLVNDLLDLSKIEAGKLELDFTAVSIADVADHALRLLQEDASRGGIILRKSIPHGLPRVVADLRALRQILLNLLSNAIKYTNSGGQVMISALIDPGGELLLRITDTGAGMSDVQLIEALQPYARVEATTRGQKGTGLGLPLSKALVEANRARFAISSAPGEGTTVDIRFPATRVLAE